MVPLGLNITMYKSNNPQNSFLIPIVGFSLQSATADAISSTSTLLTLHAIDTLTHPLNRPKNSTKKILRHSSVLVLL